MFVQALEELVYFICSPTPSPRLWDINRGKTAVFDSAFVDLVPVATDKVRRSVGL